MSAAAQYPAFQSVDRNRVRPVLVWLATLFGASCFVVAIIAAPLLLASGHLYAATALYQAFSRVCHQIPERSFYVAGYPVAVCARCSGLYVGAAVGVLIYPLFRRFGNTETPSRLLLFAAAAPTVIDFSLGFFNIWANTHASRFLTASVLGIASAFYIVPGLVDLTNFRKRSEATRTTIPGADTLMKPGDELMHTASDYSSPNRQI